MIGAPGGKLFLPPTLPMSAKTAIILIDHGSRMAEANCVVEAVAARLAASTPGEIVAFAHMELAEPSLASAFHEVVARGATRVVIVPYFLASGAHATSDIPRLAAEAAGAHPGVTWIVAEPLGLDDRLVQIARERAAEALHRLSPGT